MIVSVQLIACPCGSVTPLTMGSEGSKKRKIESAKPVQNQQPTFENATDTPESATDTYESATDTSEKNDNGESSFYFHH